MAAFSRIRVDRDQVDLLTEVLLEGRGMRIERKIALRERNPNDGELLALRWELAEINRMIEEAKRAKQDIEYTEVHDQPHDKSAV